MSGRQNCGLTQLGYLAARRQEMCRRLLVCAGIIFLLQATALSYEGTGSRPLLRIPASPAGMEYYKSVQEAVNLPLTEVSIGHLVNHRVSMDEGQITTFTCGMTLHTNPYMLDRATGDIAYVGYPYSQDDEDKRVTLNADDNPAKYRQTLEMMINTVNSALERNAIEGSLTGEEIEFLNQVLVELNKLLPSTTPDYYWGAIEDIEVEVLPDPGVTAGIECRTYAAIADGKLTLSYISFQIEGSEVSNDYGAITLDLAGGGIHIDILSPQRSYSADLLPGDEGYSEAISIMLERVADASKYTYIYEDESVKNETLATIADYLTNINRNYYYWGDIEDVEMTSTRYNPGGGSYTIRYSTEVKNGLLFVESVGSSPWGGGGPREVYVLDLASGDLMGNDPDINFPGDSGLEFSPEQKAEYLNLINAMISIVREQESRGANLESVIDYLLEIKQNLGGREYYWGAGLSHLSIPSSETRGTSVNVENNFLIISDIENYNSYNFDLLTGEITHYPLGPVESFSPDDRVAYISATRDMIALVVGLDLEGLDNQQKEDLYKVTIYLFRVFMQALMI
ncbi:MAG: hypothetical protein ABIC18_02500 [Candidatus Omnitrophota bacterium]